MAAAQLPMLKLPPLSLYVHIPWCLRKCPYCDFNSHAQGPAPLPQAAYVQALLDDLKHSLNGVQNRSLHSIFIGGGTPSLFSAQSLGQLLNGIAQVLTLPTGLEITLEANPGTAEHCDFGQLRATGINRLSIGVQSFNNAHLQRLGRIHNGQDAQNAFHKARLGGFDNINLDLMHGLPEQTPQQAEADLQQAIGLGPEHLSWYQLTLEPNTVFYSQPPRLPAEDTLADIQDAGEALLHKAGYQQYEVSAYSQGRPAQHNLNYWHFGDYLALGAGAHGKISYPDGRIERFAKTRLPQDYLNPEKAYTAGQHTLSAHQLPFEFMLNALRLTEGVPTQLFTERTGLPLSHIEAPLARTRQRGLLEDSPHQLKATALGRRFLNNLIEAFAG